MAKHLTQTQFNETKEFSVEQLALLFNKTTVRVWQLVRDGVLKAAFEGERTEVEGKERGTYRSKIRIPKKEVEKKLMTRRNWEIKFGRDYAAERARRQAKQAATEVVPEALPQGVIQEAPEAEAAQ